MNEVLSLKIKQLQFLLCVFIVIMHSMNMEYTGITSSDQAATLEYLFGGGICQLAVPCFYAISGYLFFWNCDGKEKLLEKMKSRIYSLLIPYILWNTIWEIYYVILYRIGLSDKNFEGYTIKDYLMDILLSSNTALWFVKWLLLFVALAPMISYILKNRILFIAIAGIGTISVIAFHINYYMPLYWAPLYLLGGFAGVNHSFVTDKLMNLDKRYKRVLILIAATILAALIVMQLFGVYEYRFIMLRYIGATLFLMMYLCLPVNRFELDIMQYTFPIYCMHVPICGVLKHALKGLPGFLITPVLAIGLIYMAALVLQKFFPLLYAILFGKRKPA